MWDAHEYKDRWVIEMREKAGAIDKKTGEVKEKPVYVFTSENLGASMSIDDKAIDHAGFTILSNHETGKIALMVESARADEVEQVLAKFGDKLHEIKTVSMDMSPTYAKVFNGLAPQAVQVVDKFHVMKYVYEAVGDVRRRRVKEMREQLS